MRFMLRLFGRCQLLSPAGESIVIASRKHQALIAMLAKIVVHRDMGVSSGSALLPRYQISGSQEYC